MELHTIGIDLGKTVFHLVGLNLRGEVVVGKKFLRTQLLRFAANAHVELISMKGLLTNEARSEFTPTKAVYICADQPVTSFFACGKAANHTFGMGYKPLGTAAMRQTSLNDVVKCHECSGGSK